MAEAVENEARQNPQEEEEEEEEERDGIVGHEENGTPVRRLGGVTKLKTDDDKLEEKLEEELDETELAKLTGTWWQCHLGSVRQRVAALHHLGHLFDVVLVFPEHHIEMKAHKLVLGMSSPVLEAMLYGPMSEDTESTHYLKLQDDPPDVFEWILRYLYRDDSKFQGTVQALRIYETAHKYQIDALVKICSLYVADSVEPDNFPYVFDDAVLHEDDDLLHSCYEMAAVRGQEVMSCPDLCVLRRPALRALLSFPRLRVEKESVVFRALLRWGWHHLENAPPPAHPSPAGMSAGQRVRSVIDEFLPHVRFLAMDLKEFLSEVEPSALLSPAECLAVVRGLKHLALPATLPTFVSADATLRRDNLSVVLLTNPLVDAPLILQHLDRISLNLVQNLVVGAAVHVVRLASTGVCTLREGSVVVWDEGGGHVAKGVWAGNSCLFRRPVTLTEGRRYSVMLTVREAWCVLTSTAIAVTHRRITFNGQSQCGGRLRLEYLPGTLVPPPALHCHQPPLVCLMDT